MPDSNTTNRNSAELVRTNRRQLLRAAGLGLAIPAMSQVLLACNNPFSDDAEPEPATETSAMQESTATEPMPESHETPDDGSTPEPVQPFEVYDPFVKPVEPGPKEFELTAIDQTLYIAKDIAFAGWTFNGRIPSPILRMRQGDETTIKLRVDPDATAGHSLDTHAAQTPPNESFRTIAPGEELQYTFTPKYPGAYLYHCSTPPVLMHIGTGMFGAMIVDPQEGWPPAQELVFVQNEFYIKDGPGSAKLPDFNKMATGPAGIAYVTFNGYANQYVENPIQVKVGEPIRIFVVNAGPNIWSSFHVVGAIFDAAYFNANPANKLIGQQSISIGPGNGACVELTLEEPGEYIAVNHSFGHAWHGAKALLVAG